MIEQIDFGQLDIYISSEPINLNKSIDGLAVLVQEAMGRSPKQNELFVFYNVSRDKIKLFLWDGSGFIVLYKRIEHGRMDFRRYEQTDGSFAMTPRLIRELLVGARMEHGKLKRWAPFEGKFVV
ncbi:MAG: IS66 family insertion sequence element accessory protein TnpB [Candidatus Berkiella sp.]